MSDVFWWMKMCGGWRWMFWLELLARWKWTRYSFCGWWVQRWGDILQMLIWSCHCDCMTFKLVQFGTQMLKIVPTLGCCVQIPSYKLVVKEKIGQQGLHFWVNPPLVNALIRLWSYPDDKEEWLGGDFSLAISLRMESITLSPTF